MPITKGQESLPSQWHADPKLSGSAPSAAVLSWLTESGLLTERMRKSCSGTFKLEVVADTTQSAIAADVMCRQVLLWCDEHPCIFAQTDIPATTLAAHSWLSELGNEPLGATLRQHTQATRTAFEFTQLAADSLPVNLARTEQGPLWARRSEFLLGDDRLTVTEVFLSGIANDDSALARVVG